MSKIIKAADLQVLVTTSEDIIHRSEKSKKDESESKNLKGTILEATQLIENANRERESLLNSAKQEAEAIIEEARIQAASLIEDAEAGIASEAEAAREQAQSVGREQGYQEGYEAAQSQVHSEGQELLGIIESIVDQANADRIKSLAMYEEDFLKLGLKIAEKIIKREIDSDPKWMVPIINESLVRLGSVEQISISLNPQDLAKLDTNEILNDLASDKIKLEADPVLSPGKCIISTETGAIDASLDTRLAQVRAELEEQVYVGE